MIPLPYRLVQVVSPALQQTATDISTYALQTLSIPALAEGKTILLSDMELGIVEACSGLRMVMILIAVTTALVFFMPLNRGQKVMVLLSAVPIAIVANAARIISMGIVQEWYSDHAVEGIIHDASGWMMMPFALGLVWIEMKVSNTMFPAEVEE